MSIKTISNYNTGLDLTSVSISEATYILNSFIEESINDLQIKCLLADNRSLNESGVRYFTEENDTGKQKLGDKIKQIIKTVWDVIVGIFKKIRDFFKDMITKIKEFFSKIQQKIFGKKKESEAAKKNKAAEKSDNKINTIQDEDGLHRVDQKELIQYMKDLDDKVFRDSIDKTVTKYYDEISFSYYADRLVKITNNTNAYKSIKSRDGHILINSIQKFLNDLPEADKHHINKEIVIDCAFGNFSKYYKEVDNAFKTTEIILDNLLDFGTVYEDPEYLSLVKDLLKLTTECSKKYSSVMIHNTNELMKVVHYIYNNYDRDGVSVKESVDWSSIL